MSEQTTLKVGDTVKLKSGGPVMTVELIHGDGRINCAWFDKDNPTLFTGTIRDGALEVASPSVGVR